MYSTVKQYYVQSSTSLPHLRGALAVKRLAVIAFRREISLRAEEERDSEADASQSWDPDYVVQAAIRVGQDPKPEQSGEIRVLSLLRCVAIALGQEVGLYDGLWCTRRVKTGVRRI